MLPVEADEAVDHASRLLVANVAKVVIQKEAVKIRTARRKPSPSHF